MVTVGGGEEHIHNHRYTFLGWYDITVPFGVGEPIE